MKNNFKFFLVYLTLSFGLFLNLNANEQFVFDVTEIEILENGNLIVGKKGGKVTVEDGSIITANDFKYNKILNILEAQGNVKFENEIEEIVIFSDNAIYNKNLEQLITKGNSKAIKIDNIITANTFIYKKELNTLKASKNVKIVDSLKDVIILSGDVIYNRNEETFFSKGLTESVVEKKYNIKSADVLFSKNISTLSSSKKTIINDNKLNQYELDNFKYDINKKLLKGKNVKITSHVENEKKDNYFFSDGFFNFMNNSFVSKETKINLHKDIFKNDQQDPRLYGVSSTGDDKKTVINKGIFTSCSQNENCPSWSITSEKITHDKIKRDMIYENAILKIYDVPVLYFPKFFHPDPTVERRSGFLQPQLNNSKILGSSIFLPYFNVISENKDLTFKPTFFEDKKYILQSEYRQKNKNSDLITDFGLTKGYQAIIDGEKNNRNSIGHLFLEHNYDLQLENYKHSKIKTRIERVTNDTYLKVFQNNIYKTPVMPESQSVMKNEITFELNNDKNNFKSGIELYENLGVKNSDRYQYVFPYYEFSKNLINDDARGSLNFSSYGSNNLINTNNLTTKITNNISYISPGYISKVGFENKLGLYGKNFNTVAKNNSNYKNSPQIDAMSLLELSSAFPLIKSNYEVVETLTPRISLLVNPKNNMKNNNDKDSEINVDNIFNIDRLKLSDSFEPGKSITVGIDYKYDLIEEYSIDEDENLDEKFKNEIIFKERDKNYDKYLDFKLAAVIRDEADNKIPENSTLGLKRSNIFGSLSANLIDNIDLGYKFAIDDDLSTINSNNINSTIYLNNFITTFDFIEERGPIGTSHLIKNTSTVKFDNNNFLRFETRRNKEINLTEYYDLSYEYRNDCLKAALKYNKMFYKDKDLKPTENLFFTISIIPITTYERSLYRR